MPLWSDATQGLRLAGRAKSSAAYSDSFLWMAGVVRRGVVRTLYADAPYDATARDRQHHKIVFVAASFA
jgi:hypothetical protein